MEPKDNSHVTRLHTCSTSPPSTLLTRGGHLLHSVDPHHTETSLSRKAHIYIVGGGFSLGVVHFMGLDKCMMPSVHHYSIIQNYFNTLKLLCPLPLSPSLPVPYPHNAVLFTVFIVLSFSECHVVEIIQYSIFRLLSLSDMHLKFFRVFSWLHSSFVSNTEL